MAVKGPTEGVKQQVIDKLQAISNKLGKDVTITADGGKRNGPINASAHNSGIAADAYVGGMKSIAFADELVDAGFTGVGEYYKADGTTEERFAHGDIRGLPGSEQSGAYAVGGEKSSPVCWYRIGPDGGIMAGSRKSGHKCPQRSRALSGEDTPILALAEEASTAVNSEDLYYTLVELYRDNTDEERWWKEHKSDADAAFALWEKFLVMRKGSGNDKNLDDKDRAQFMCAIRAVSWVESKHGHGTGHHPDRDPMQGGNPEDFWWQLLIGKHPKKDRFVRGPGATPNYFAEELPGVIKDYSGVPAEAKLGHLGDKEKGHNDAKFNSKMSYYWSVAYLIYCINKKGVSGGKAYAWGDCSTNRMQNGANEYNGGGNPDYLKLIKAAWKLIGCK